VRQFVNFSHSPYINNPDTHASCTLGVPVAGVMHQPFVGEEETGGRTIYALNGMGVTGVTQVGPRGALASHVIHLVVKG